MSMSNMEFDYDLFKQILLVIIPIIGGAMSVYKITNSWQKHKDKIEMKEKVILAFEKAAKDVFNIQYNFYIKLVTKYTIIQNTDRLIGTGEIDIKIKKYPLELNEQPLKFFEKEHNEMQESLLKSRYDGSHFLTLLKFYYEDKILKNDYDKLKRQLKEGAIILDKIINLTRDNDFIKLSNEYQIKTNESRLLIDDIEENLIKNKLRNIPT